MSHQSGLAAAARELLEDMRSRTDGFDGTDGSLWFVQGALASMANDPRRRAGAGLTARFAYALYVAELLESSCPGVHVEVEAADARMAEVSAVSDHGRREFVFSWVERCVEDPNADNIVFKYAGALRDFDQPARAARLDEQLRELAASGHRF